jgi:trigger factor
MQVQEIKNEGLKREISVKVPASEIQGLVTTRLEDIAKKAKIDGFRPGKAPLSLIRQRYGASVHAEVLDEAINDNVQKALDERKWRPAMQPKVDLVEMGEGKDLEFKVALEVLPEIKLGDFSKIKLERPVVEVPDTEVDDTILRAAKRFREPALVTEARAAKMGDVVVIDFDGSVNGDHKPGMKAEKHKLELGTKSFIDTFEEQIVGMKTGDEKDIKVTFPAEYHAKDLAGQKAVFAVKLHEIREHKEAKLDDELAKEMGFTAIADLKKHVKDDLAEDYAKGARAVMKRKLLDQLSDMHKFEVPPTLLDTEFDGIWKQVEQAKKTGELPEDDKKKSDDELKKEYRGIAERRIRLGLVLAEVGQEQKIQITPNEIRNAMMAEARRFPGQEQAVFNYYTKTEGAIDRLRAPILEEKTVDYIVSKAVVTDKPMKADELNKLAAESDDE